MPGPTPGVNSSQTPEAPSVRIGQVRASQKFASLTTLTPSALGAQTAEGGSGDALVLDDASAEDSPRAGCACLRRSGGGQVRQGSARTGTDPPAPIRVRRCGSGFDSPARRPGRLPRTGRRHARRRMSVIPSGRATAGAGRLWVERPDAQDVSDGARSEEFVGIVQTAGEHLLDRRFELGRARILDGHELAPRRRKPKRDGHPGRPVPELVADLVDSLLHLEARPEHERWSRCGQDGLGADGLGGMSSRRRRGWRPPRPRRSREGSPPRRCPARFAR